MDKKSDQDNHANSAILTMMLTGRAVEKTKDLKIGKTKDEI